MYIIIFRVDPLFHIFFYILFSFRGYCCCWQKKPKHSSKPTYKFKHSCDTDLNQHVKRPSVIMPVPVISDKQNDKRKLADAIIRKWNKKLNFRLWDFSPPPSLYVVQPLKKILCMSSLSQFQIITWNIQTGLFIILSHLQLFFYVFRVFNLWFQPSNTQL